MERLIKADAPNFNNHETYSYFCITVLPSIFEKLRLEKRLEKVEKKEIEFKGDVRLYTGECFEGEPAGKGTSVGKGLGPCTGTGFGSEGDIGIMMTKPKSKIVSKPKYSGSWFNQLPHGLVTIEFPDTQIWVCEMKANQQFGKRTIYYPKEYKDVEDEKKWFFSFSEGKIINLVDKNNRYKMMKDLGSNKEEAFYKIGAAGPEPHRAL